MAGVIASKPIFVMKFLWVGLFCISPLAAGIVPNRYVVELSGDPVAVQVSKQGPRAMSSNEAQDHRTQLRAAQQRARATIERQTSAQVLGSTDTVANTLIVRADEATAAALTALPGVLRVRPVRQLKLNLDHALPVHRVPQAWSLVGFDLAGFGIKIGMIDTGIDVSHPGFQDATLPVPSGFPKVNADSDLRFTNNKVIVARSYVDLLSTPDDDISARDRTGHGTATAMAAAGVLTTGPLATISGVAPKAYLGSYKVFGSPGVNDMSDESVVLKAIDDAVADGMDVINLSLGSPLAPSVDNDVQVEALERAAALGVIVVVVTGNSGPDPGTIETPGTAPSAISVGASRNERIFAGSATVPGVAPYVAIAGSGPNSAAPITAPLLDIAEVDHTSLACSALPADSLRGRMVLILRGVCNFEDKLLIAQAAGAVAALIYSDRDRPDPLKMGVGTATLPASMVSYEDGIDLKRRVTENSGLQATLSFELLPGTVNPYRLANFSSVGPTAGGAIKPDLLAVGTDVYTAAEMFDPQGAIYDPSGFSLEQGTSFSAPLVAGAAALIKSARPGLTPAQYRSLLINSATSFPPSDRAPLGVQAIGAGLLNVDAAVRSTAAASPSAINFGIGGPNPSLSRTLLVTNVGTAQESFALWVASPDGGLAPALSRSTADLAPGGSLSINVTLRTIGLQPGSYEGFVVVQGASTGIETRIPYWYGIGSDVPRNITVLDQQDDQRPGSSVSDAIVFRVTDTSGIVASGANPQVTTVSGGGEVLRVARNREVPGAYTVAVRLGSRRGSNVFRIRAGSVSKDVTLLSR